MMWFVKSIAVERSETAIDLANHIVVVETRVPSAMRFVKSIAVERSETAIDLANRIAMGRRA